MVISSTSYKICILKLWIHPGILECYRMTLEWNQGLEVTCSHAFYLYWHRWNRLWQWMNLRAGFSTRTISGQVYSLCQKFYWKCASHVFCLCKFIGEMNLYDEETSWVLHEEPVDSNPLLRHSWERVIRDTVVETAVMVLVPVTKRGWRSGDDDGSYGSPRPWTCNWFVSNLLIVICWLLTQLMAVELVLGHFLYIDRRFTSETCYPFFWLLLMCSVFIIVWFPFIGEVSFGFTQEAVELVFKWAHLRHINTYCLKMIHLATQI